jgi:hypothetical protein
MRTTIAMILWFVSAVLQTWATIGVVGLFIYGIYTLFAKSIVMGLALIGASVVSRWIAEVICNLLTLAGLGTVTIGAKKPKDPI